MTQDRDTSKSNPQKTDRDIIWLSQFVYLICTERRQLAIGCDSLRSEIERCYWLDHHTHELSKHKRTKQQQKEKIHIFVVLNNFIAEEAEDMFMFEKHSS